MKRTDCLNCNSERICNELEDRIYYLELRLKSAEEVLKWYGDEKKGYTDAGNRAREYFEKYNKKNEN